MADAPHYTPGSLSERWVSTADHVLALIHAGELDAYSISPPGSKRPRYRISPESVAEYERLHSNRPQPAAATATKQRRRARPRVAFYT